MAIYHLSAQVIRSSTGHSAVAAAASRRAAALVCQATGQVFDCRAKAGVTHAELSLPTETPAWFRTAIDGLTSDRSAEVLWNAVEAKEGLKGTGLAMVLDIALPVELNGAQRVALARDWVENHVTARGFVADWAVREDDGNPHFHVMIPLRCMTDKGFGPKYELRRDAAGNVIFRDDGKPRYERMALPMKELLGWRRSWAETTNHHLATAGFEVRIDHRSHADAGIEREPTRHRGVIAHRRAAKRQAATASRSTP
ncbi:MobA/MobL family protein [Methylobacterium ajmalii]|uniref:MobA/MobL family protein n=1 Tax=Methylobacterium ajmalii TaxID=2738439 RepID=A0ABV0A4N4_9HYPH|nr:MobA/MobL family protein [uncultured Methylobacterium sp.]